LLGTGWGLITAEDFEEFGVDEESVASDLEVSKDAGADEFVEPLRCGGVRPSS